jgi:hypothetical protein
MAGLDPPIHVFLAILFKTWMPVTSTGTTVMLASFAASVATYRFRSFGGFFGGGGRLGGGAARFGNPP